MKSFSFAIGLGLIATRSLAADAVPRGVGPDFAKFYQDRTKFTCISNPSISLSFSQVNDDYCDCPDGSDEPGTSACSSISISSPPQPHVHPADANVSLALPGFYCANKGHRPGYVPFTWVNDGHCDYEQCCDGSEEWSGLVKCPNKCSEIGKEWRKHYEARQKSLGVAAKQRKELAKEGLRMKKEVEDRIKTLGAEIEAAERKVTQMEQELVDIEKTEKLRMVKGTGKVDKTAVLIEQAKARTQELLHTLQRVRQDRDWNRSYKDELEGYLKQFKEEYNPNFNDEGVKRAVRSWENYAARGRYGNVDSAFEQELQQVLKSDEENGVHWDEYAGEETSDVDVLYQFEAYLPAPLRDWVDVKLRDLRVWLVENGILAQPNTQQDESWVVKEARDRLQNARNELDNLVNDRNNKQNDLTLSYGPDDVFRALRGRCVETDSGEYTYEMCWLEKTTQKPKKGGANTGMGNYVRVETMFVDEDLPADGRGLGTGERYAIKYENGQHCWNGPNRATTVILACAEKDEIWKVMEEEKCIYRMEVGTPAVCEPPSGDAIAKDEL